MVATDRVDLSAAHTALERRTLLTALLLGNAWATSGSKHDFVWRLLRRSKTG